MAARWDARETKEARRLNWIAQATYGLGLVLLVVLAAWLIPRHALKQFVDPTKAALVADDYDGSAPKSGSADGWVNTSPEQTSPAAALARTGLNRDQVRDHPRPEPERSPRPAYANPATVSDLGGTCIGGRVFRSKVTNGVTVITEIADLRCQSRPSI